MNIVEKTQLTPKISPFATQTGNWLEGIKVHFYLFYCRAKKTETKMPLKWIWSGKGRKVNKWLKMGSVNLLYKGREILKLGKQLK